MARAQGRVSHGPAFHGKVEDQGPDVPEFRRTSKALPSNFARPQDNSGNARILAGRARILAIVFTILHAVGRARTQRLPRGDAGDFGTAPVPRG